MKPDSDKLLSVAREAALTAGAHLKQSYGKHMEVTYKGEVNLVTQVDLESQDIVHNIIKKHFPGHSFLAEEDLDEKKDSECLWLIDPIDGTTNFASSIPIFCVSIAFQFKGQGQAGVVYVPLLDEMFHAAAGGGAFLNGQRLAVSEEKEIGQCLVATGFPYDRRECKNNNVDHFSKFILKARGIRRMGSAAIDLCYTAAGRLGGFWEPKLYAWDTAAGLLMVREAGGKVTDFSGNPFNPFMKECLASNGYIHGQMIEILNTPC